MIEHRVNLEYSGMRLDRFVGKHCRSLSKAAVQKMIRTGRVKLNGKKSQADVRLCAGDAVRIFMPRTEETQEPKKLNLPPPEILYEDEFLLAVNKPAGLVIHPDGKKEDSLSGRIVSYLYENSKTYGGAFTPGVATRLDTNTSGIVLAPKTPSAARELAALTRENEISKTYLTLVEGSFPKNKKAVHYASKDTVQNKMLLTEEPREGAVKMISAFTPLEERQGTTLLSARLITGRTHQIRAQLEALGYPVAGDRKYGCEKFNRELYPYGLTRQFLHCFSVRLPLWYDHSTLKIDCAPPEDLKGVLQALSFSEELYMI